jgi:hypothetical protein
VAHGSPVLEYEILFSDSDGAYDSSTSCDGKDAAVLSTRSCQLSYVELRGSQFALTLGMEVVVMVKARNVIGWSPFSTANSVRDIVKTPPLSPTTMVKEEGQTDSSQI